MPGEHSHSLAIARLFSPIARYLSISAAFASSPSRSACPGVRPSCLPAAFRCRSASYVRAAMNSRSISPARASTVAVIFDDSDPSSTRRLFTT